MDQSFEELCASANASLDTAESLYLDGNIDAAAHEILKAAVALSDAGVLTLEEIQPVDLAKLDGTTAKILRRLADDSGLLPDGLDALASIEPELRTYIPESTADLSANELVNSAKKIYTAEPGAAAGTDYLPLIDTLASLIKGQQSVRGMIFSEDGIYDTFALTAAPYLIAGAAYFAKNDDGILSSEEKITRMLDGPVKRLVMLFYSLVTSAFASGLLLLLIRRALAVRKSRPGCIDNASFMASAAALTVSNLPMLISGLRAVSSELAELKRIASA
ncbi:MAG: hypothetical protein Q4Q04_02760 [Methanocorpusculum sp.]|nr:hypothetical protein [Methanocorpusculum sp.]